MSGTMIKKQHQSTKFSTIHNNVNALFQRFKANMEDSADEINFPKMIGRCDGSLEQLEGIKRAVEQITNKEVSYCGDFKLTANSTCEVNE
jgi:hypothetical protein